MNQKGKEIDTTSLYLLRSTGTNDLNRRGMIHRDYLAHCLRWSHVVRYLTRGHRHRTARVLDVGCGKEAPLMRLLYASQMTHTTGSYLGIDAGPVPWPELIKKGSAKFRAELIEGVDFAEVPISGSLRFDVIVCLEALEHVEGLHAFKILRRMRKLCAATDARVFVSTPCYDPHVGAANNHVNELSREALSALLYLAGFIVDAVYGTFASQRDYKEDLEEMTGGREIFEALSSYYDTNVVACLFAPLFPQRARNCLWSLIPNATPPTEIEIAPTYARRLARPELASSSRWPDDVKRILKEIKNDPRS